MATRRETISTGPERRTRYEPQDDKVEKLVVIASEPPPQQENLDGSLWHVLWLLVSFSFCLWLLLVVFGQGHIISCGGGCCALQEGSTISPRLELNSTQLNTHTQQERRERNKTLIERHKERSNKHREVGILKLCRLEGGKCRRGA